MSSAALFDFKDNLWLLGRLGEQLFVSGFQHGRQGGQHLGLLLVLVQDYLVSVDEVGVHHDLALLLLLLHLAFLRGLLVQGLLDLGLLLLLLEHRGRVVRQLVPHHLVLLAVL